jgi:hypothetical protein
MSPTRSVNEILEELKQNKKKVRLDEVDYYVVEGDLRLDMDQLLAYAFEIQERDQHGASKSKEEREPLVGITDATGRVVRWKKGLVLTYQVLKCTFATIEQYQMVVDAVHVATADWENACGINFKHLSELDGGELIHEPPLFQVKGVNTDGQFIAMAFFPDEPPPRRELVIDPSFFSPTLGFDRAGVLRHELGHVLGFRHEHIRSEAPAICPDEPLGNTTYLATNYDPRSVMHYFCGGAGSRDLNLTDIDRAAARKLYGPPDREVHYCG